jgi:hypothetical protein
MGKLISSQKIIAGVFGLKPNTFYRVKSLLGSTYLYEIFNASNLYAAGSDTISIWQNGDINSTPITALNNDPEWIDPISEQNIDNTLIPVGAVIIINSSLDHSYSGAVLVNYYQGRTSIKKQNSTKLKPYSINGGTTTYDDRAVYIFKGGSTNTISTVFNYLELQGGISYSFADGIFIDGAYYYYKTGGLGGAGWRNNLSPTIDRSNTTISINQLIYFTPRSLKEISVGSGAIIQRDYNGNLNLNNYYPDDSDAKNYILAVEAVEGSLEVGVKKAINNFVVGCKSDGIWTAIKASCLLAGPKTLVGALVPLSGTAPTNVNFTSSDYNRKTGLKGDGSTKYLNSNRANNADPQDSKHVAAYLTESPTRDATRSMITVDTTISNLFLGTTTTSIFFRINHGSLTPTSIVDANLILGLFGGSRNSSSNVNTRYNQNNGTLANTSINPSSTSIYIFSREALTNYSNARIAFYSIGENINLEKLEDRLRTYVNALGALII